MAAVLIVCAAGASSTFLAHRLRTAAREASLDFTFDVTAVSELDLRLTSLAPSTVLVAAHLSSQFDDIAQKAQHSGSSAYLLPEVGLDPAGSARVLELLTNSQHEQGKGSARG